MTDMPLAALVAAKNSKDKPFVRYLDRLLNESDKSQRQIAYEIGYDKPNIVTMFKQGTTRVPVEKIPALALALDVDASDMLRMWLEQYEPVMAQTLFDNMGMSLSKNERSWVAHLRRTFSEGVPPWGPEFEHVLKPLAT